MKVWVEKKKRFPAQSIQINYSGVLLEWNTWLVFVRILNWVCIFHSSKCFLVSTLRQPTSAEKCSLSFLLSDLENPKKQNVLNLLQTSAACHSDIRSAGQACTPTGLLQTTTAEVLVQFCWENTRGQCLKIKSWELWLQEALQFLFPMTLFLTLTHSRQPTSRMFTFSPAAARGCSVFAESAQKAERPERLINTNANIQFRQRAKQDCGLHLICVARRATWLSCMSEAICKAIFKYLHLLLYSLI